MFEQQSSEDAGPVLGSDLVRDDHRLHHQMGDARQRVLLQVQENGACGTAAEEGRDQCDVRSQRLSSFTLSLFFPLKCVPHSPSHLFQCIIRVQESNKWAEFTVRDGTTELQQAAEGQGGHVRLSPAIRLLLHVLLKLDPASSLLPAHFMILLHNQLVQLHKQLRRKTLPNHSGDICTEKVF